MRCGWFSVGGVVGVVDVVGFVWSVWCSVAGVVWCGVVMCVV